MKIKTLMVGAVFTAALLGCVDKAKGRYHLCLDAEAQENWATATTLCQEAVALDPKSESGRAAAAKLASFEAVPATVDKQWCSRLHARLKTRLEPEAIAANPRQQAGFLRSALGEHLDNMEYECQRAAGKPTAGLWQCRWDEHLETEKQCDVLSK